MDFRDYLVARRRSVQPTSVFGVAPYQSASDLEWTPPGRSGERPTDGASRIPSDYRPSVREDIETMGRGLMSGIFGLVKEGVKTGYNVIGADNVVDSARAAWRGDWEEAAKQARWTVVPGSEETFNAGRAGFRGYRDGGAAGARTAAWDQMREDVPFTTSTGETFAGSYMRLPTWAPHIVAAPLDWAGFDGAADTVRDVGSDFFERQMGHDLLQRAGVINENDLQAARDAVRYRPVSSAVEDIGNASAAGGVIARAVGGAGRASGHAASRAASRATGAADDLLRNLDRELAPLDREIRARTAALGDEAAAASPEVQALIKRRDSIRNRAQRNIDALRDEAARQTALFDEYKATRRGSIAQVFDNIAGTTNRLDPTDYIARTAYRAIGRGTRAAVQAVDLAAGKVGAQSIQNAVANATRWFDRTKTERGYKQDLASVQARSSRETLAHSVPTMRLADSIANAGIDEVAQAVAALDVSDRATAWFQRGAATRDTILKGYLGHKILRDTPEVSGAARATAEGHVARLQQFLEREFDANRINPAQVPSLDVIAETVEYFAATRPEVLGGARVAPLAADRIAQIQQARNLWRSFSESLTQTYLRGFGESEVVPYEEIQRRRAEDVGRVGPRQSVVDERLNPQRAKTAAAEKAAADAQERLSAAIAEFEAAYGLGVDVTRAGVAKWIAENGPSSRAASIIDRLEAATANVAERNAIAGSAHAHVLDMRYQLEALRAQADLDSPATLAQAEGAQRATELRRRISEAEQAIADTEAKIEQIVESRIPALIDERLATEVAQAGLVMEAAQHLARVQANVEVRLAGLQQWQQSLTDGSPRATLLPSETRTRDRGAGVRQAEASVGDAAKSLRQAARNAPTAPERTQMRKLADAMGGAAGNLSDYRAANAGWVDGPPETYSAYRTVDPNRIIQADLARAQRALADARARYDRAVAHQQRVNAAAGNAAAEAVTGLFELDERLARRHTELSNAVKRLEDSAAVAQRRVERAEARSGKAVGSLERAAQQWDAHLDRLVKRVADDAARTATDLARQVSVIDQLARDARQTGRAAASARTRLDKMTDAILSRPLTAPPAVQPLVLAAKRQVTESRARRRALREDFAASSLATWASDLKDKYPTPADLSKAMSAAESRIAKGQSANQQMAAILERFYKEHPEAVYEMQMTAEALASMRYLVEGTEFVSGTDTGPTFLPGGSVRRLDDNVSVVSTGGVNAGRQKTAAESTRKTGYLPLTFEQAFDLRARELNRMVQNRTHAEIVARHGKFVIEERDIMAANNEVVRFTMQDDGRDLVVTADTIMNYSGELLADIMAKRGYTALDTRNQASASSDFKLYGNQVSQTTVFLPTDLVSSLQAQWKTVNGLERFLNATYDRATSFWKRWVLAMSPRWHVNAVAGNSIMLTAAGVRPMDAVRQLPHALALYRRIQHGNLSKADLEALRVYEADSVAVAGDYREARILERRSNIRFVAGYQNIVSKSYRLSSFIDNVSRLILYLERRDRGFSAEQAVRDATKTFGEYSRMSFTERTVLRRVFTFYAWIRTITKFALSLPLEHPVRTAWLMSLNSRFGESDEYPEFMFGAPMGGFLFPVGGADPFGSLLGDGLTPSGLLSGVNPYLGLGYTFATGQRIDGRPVYMPPGTDAKGNTDVLWNQFLRLTPQSRAFFDRSGVSRYADGTPRLDGADLRTRDRVSLPGIGELPYIAEDALRVGGVPFPRPYDLEEELRKDREYRRRDEIARWRYQRRVDNAGS